MDGVERAQWLEQARSKLLYAPQPKGCNLHVELGKRIALWERQEFEELLLRAEAQAAARAQQRRLARGVGAAQQARVRRAEGLAREGAFSKATSTLDSEVAQLSPAEEQRWATQLLPGSSQPSEACSGQPATIPMAVDSGGADGCGSAGGLGAHSLEVGNL